MIADRPLHRLRLAAGAGSFVVGAAVCITILLLSNPYGVPRVVAGLVVASAVVAIAAGKHLKRSAASRATDGTRLAASLQSPVPMQCLRPRQTSDDYDWYPDRVPTDRTRTARRRFGR